MIDCALGSLEAVKKPWLVEQITFYEAFQAEQRVQQISAEDWDRLQASKWPKRCPVEWLRIGTLMLVTPGQVFGLWQGEQLKIVNLGCPESPRATFDLTGETVDDAWDSACHRFYQTMPREWEARASALRQVWMDMVRGCLCVVLGMKLGEEKNHD